MELDYNKIKAVNAHSLEWFDYSPSKFIREYENKYSVIQREEEESADFYTMGSAIHNKILEPASFDSNFVVLNTTKNKSSNQEDFCRDVARSIKAFSDFDLDSRLSEIYAKHYKTATKKNLSRDALALFNEKKDYIYRLNSDDKRSVLTTSQYSTVTSCINAVQNHKQYDAIFNTLGDVQAFNEYAIVTDANGLLVKGKIDRFIIDFAKKIITLVEVKTTSSSVYSFRESFDKYNYLRQLAFYTMLIFKFMQEHFKVVTIEEYGLDCIFVIVSTGEGSECRYARVSALEVLEYMTTLKHRLEELKWHFDNDLWDYSRSYYVGDGIENL